MIPSGARLLLACTVLQGIAPSIAWVFSGSSFLVRQTKVSHLFVVQTYSCEAGGTALSRSGLVTIGECRQPTVRTP